MLVEKSFFEEGEVAAFRLVSGDEIIGEVVKRHEDTVDIKKPCTLAMGQDGKGGGKPGNLLLKVHIRKPLLRGIKDLFSKWKVKL